MSNNGVRTMPDITNDNGKNQQESGEELEAPTMSDKKKSPAKNLRELSYMVLFIAAVFVINAMETGSYRTPWPVAFISAALGFGLLAFSFYHTLHDRHKDVRS
jgi:hypothetical protein